MLNDNIRALQFIVNFLQSKRSVHCIFSAMCFDYPLDVPGSDAYDFFPGLEPERYFGKCAVFSSDCYQDICRADNYSISYFSKSGSNGHIDIRICSTLFKPRQYSDCDTSLSIRSSGSGLHHSAESAANQYGFIESDKSSNFFGYCEQLFIRAS